MKILALEFSSPQRSVAVVQGNDFHESLSGSNEPFAMIDEALRAAKVEREQIECIVIGLGPGSYTGIRSAISIAMRLIDRPSWAASNRRWGRLTSG